MVARVICFLAGILLIQQLSTLPEAIWIAAFVIILAVMAWLRYWQVAFFISGILWAVIFSSITLNDRLPEQLAGQDIELQGYIADLPEHEEHHVRFNFRVKKPADDIPDKIRLTWYYPDQSVKAGQKWVLTVRLKQPHGNFNPGGFDYERWLFVEGIGATGYVRTKPAPKLLSDGTSDFSLLVWRQHISDLMDRILVDNESLPLIKALTIGDGNSLTPQQWEVFRKTGTTHLMVISGSHIGLIAGLVYLLTLKLWARTGIFAWSPQQVAAIMALVISLFYAGLTGFSVPAQRSAIMIAIAMIAVIQQHNTRPFHILAIALLAVLFIDPLVVLSAGFWLSFIAVSLIIYSLAGRLGKPGFIWGSIKINWITSVGLAPLLLLFFQQVSVIAPLANLIAVPIIGLVIVPLALLATLVMFIVPIAAEKLFFAVDITLQGLWWLLLRLSDLPQSTISHSQPSWWALCFALPGILLLFAPKGIPSRWLGIIMLLPLVVTRPGQIESGTIKMTLLDVGQGLSAVVQMASHVLVFDTGAKFSSSSDMGQTVLTPFLRSQGIDKINTLIVSHGDNDYIGGVNSLLNNFKTENVLTSVPQQLNQYSTSPCRIGQSWSWDNVKFAILSPQIDCFMSDNDNSCVLSIQATQGTVLLTGDIEALAESVLVKNFGSQLKADVLIAPHHGSQTSSSPSFLRSVAPKLVLIPAGYRNQFGHPHKEVLDRYRQLPVTWFNSADDGAILIDIDNNLKAASWRAVAGRYWNYKK